MPKPVLFVSFRPLSRAENMKALFDAYKGDKVYILSTDPNYRNEVLSGKYSVMVTDDFPSVSPGKCIVVWHGIQGGKHIGFDQPGHPYFSKETSDLITYIVSASTGMVDTWSKCTGVPADRIMPLGFPRTDQYFSYHKQEHDKKTYLYVPTFRDKKDPPFHRVNWDMLDSLLSDDEVFVVKAHPWQVKHNRNQVSLNGQYKHITIAHPEEPTTPYLYDADIVVTDYSSIMFDAYLLDKPVVLFDKEPGYAYVRGMYLEYPDEYCTYFAQDEQTLIKFLRFRADNPRLTFTEILCRHTVAGMCYGISCDKICSLIDDINK